MNLDGAWQADFGSDLSGQGVVLLRNGKVLGCDHQYFYDGTYETEGNGTIKAHITVEHYAGEPRSIFGDFGPSVALVGYRVELHGVAVGGRVQLNGTINGDPDRALVIMLTRLMPVTPPTS
jgi:hypothetical protein